MNKKIIHIAAFGSGFAFGIVVAWRLAKNYYEQIANKEIDSVKKAFKRRSTQKDDNSSDDISELSDMISNLGYDDSSPDTEEDEPDPYIPDKSNDSPYVISPDDFGEMDDYECISLTYYSDNVLTDDADDIIDDVDDIIGFKSLAHFGEYEDDSVFVRNDKLKCDYEILLDERKYAERKVRRSNE